MRLRVIAWNSALLLLGASLAASLAAGAPGVLKPKPAVRAPASAAAKAPAPAALAAGANPARLPHVVRPTSESLDLTLDPAQQGYGGSVTIGLKVSARADSFQLNSRSLAITRLALAGPTGEIPVTHSLAARERITVRAAKPLEPGSYTLEIGFTQEFGTRATSLYHVKHGSDWYSFTDFECDNAREAFPCWDEPEFKIPWQVKLTAPDSDLVLSNTPIEGTATQRHRKTVSFQQTPPLPSYLVAFMCGPFDAVPVPGPPIPTRIITLRGQGALAAEAVRQVPPILGALEAYFGRDYPYKKLDFIGVPEYLWGAMENPGAITFVDSGLLLDPVSATGAERRRLASTLAHELSHMWFGDFVTLEWWDDVWLNESFASWMGDKITQLVFPEFNLPLEELDGTYRAYAQDDLLSTHAMRERVGDGTNLDQVFDALAYDKGEAVLGMIEQWIGPDEFRNGVLGYLEAHAWGNAEAADLWHELSKASGKDVTGVLETFLDQPGVPIVRARLLPGGQVELSQQRYVVAGEAAPIQSPWKIPVVLRFSDGKKEYTQRVLLTSPAERVTLEPPITPLWLHPNADERGYYHWQVSPDQMSALASAPLGERERAGYVRNLKVLLSGGMLHGDEYLMGLARFAHDASPRVGSAVLDGLDHVKRTFVTDSLRPEFARYVAHTLRPMMDRLGETPKPGESVDAAELRARVIAMLGWDGGDAGLRASGLERARAWLVNPASLDPTLIDPMIRLSALSNDTTLYAAYRDRFENAQGPEDHVRFLTSFGWFHDPALVDRTLDYALHGPLHAQDFRRVFIGMDTEALRMRVWDWSRQHYAQLATRLPVTQRSTLIRYADGCSRERLEAARAFFSDPARDPVGADRELSELAGRVASCVSDRDREGAAVARALAASGDWP